MIAGVEPAERVSLVALQTSAGPLWANSREEVKERLGGSFDVLRLDDFGCIERERQGRGPIDDDGQGGAFFGQAEDKAYNSSLLTIGNSSSAETISLNIKSLHFPHKS